MAAQATIPVVRRATKKAGWSEIVAPFQKEAIFWNRIWVECGKPESGWVFEIRNRTRKEYKSRSRWVVRNQDKLKSGKMASCILENRSRDFWSEVRKVRGVKSCPTSRVDGVEGNDAVCELFRSKYEELYNSVSFEQSDIDVLRDDVCSTMLQPFSLLLLIRYQYSLQVIKTDLDLFSSFNETIASGETLVPWVHSTK